MLRPAPERVTLQHDSYNRAGAAVAHWREDWRHGAAGWRQTVFSLTPDHPEREQRYSCTAPWSANRWRCEAGRAPKPCRDDGAPFGVRRPDYNWLHRDNTLLVTPEGRVQSQHNRKIDAGGRLIGHELGFIVYERLRDSACGEAGD